MLFQRRNKRRVASRLVGTGNREAMRDKKSTARRLHEIQEHGEIWLVRSHTAFYKPTWYEGEDGYNRIY